MLDSEWFVGPDEQAMSPTVALTVLDDGLSVTGCAATVSGVHDTGCAGILAPGSNSHECNKCNFSVVDDDRKSQEILVDSSVESQPVQLLELRYCNVQFEMLPEPTVALTDNGAQISLIREDLIKDLYVTGLGTVAIRGAVGQPVEAKLVILNVEPWRGCAEENIAPYLGVTFPACNLSTDVDVIFCENDVSQMNELNAYNLLRPSRSSETTFEAKVDFSEIESCADSLNLGSQDYDLQVVKVIDANPDLSTNVIEVSAVNDDHNISSAMG